MSYFFSEAARVEHLEHVAHYESFQVGLCARYMLAFDVAMGPSAKLRIVIELNFRLLFVSTAFQVCLTTSSIELFMLTLKFWSLPHIVDGRAIGWVGFNWSPKAEACGSAWLRP